MLDSVQLVERLTRLGVTIDIEKLQRWSKQQLIPHYKSYYQPRRKKKGRPPKALSLEGKVEILEKARLGRISEWPEETVKWAAAVWALRYCGDIKSRTLTKELIEVVRRSARSIYSSAPVECTIPPITRWIGGEQPLPLPEQFQLQFAPNYPADDKRILLLPGETHEERAEKLNELIKIWIATIEKARDAEWVGNTGGKDDASPITQRAQVRIYFTSSSTRRLDANGTFEFELSSKYDHTEIQKLENSESDEIVLYENGTDVRVLMLRKLSAQSLVIFGKSP